MQVGDDDVYKCDKYARWAIIVDTKIQSSNKKFGMPMKFGWVGGLALGVNDGGFRNISFE